MGMAFSYTSPLMKLFPSRRVIIRWSNWTGAPIEVGRILRRVGIVKLS